MQKIQLTLFLILFSFSALSAQETATVEGFVLDSNQNPIVTASVAVMGESGGTITNEKGYYQLTVPANKQISIKFSHISYKSIEKTLQLSAQEVKILTVTIKQSTVDIGVIQIEEERSRTKNIETIDPKSIKLIPSSSGSFEAVIKTLPGVSSNNELTSQYNVRGGNYDENLVYVNDIQVYRPFLVRSGEQEGLSFINPDLIHNINFSAGGFEPRYGDKMSSVLAVEYKKPKEFGGTATASLLGGALSIEGADKNQRFSYIAGMRYHSNQYVLKSLDTQGDYKPVFADFQTYLTYDITDKWEISFLGNYARNQYNFIPTTRETNFGTIQQALRLTIYFEGEEVTDFETFFGALTNTYKPNPNIELKFTTSAFRSFETETFDILGQYRIDELDKNLGSEDFGDVAFSRGVGSYLNHGRNYLNATVANFQHRGKLFRDNGALEWGATLQHEAILDKINEWDLIDSSGYSLPQNPFLPGQTPNRPLTLELHETLRARKNLNSNRLMGYVQRSYSWDDEQQSEYTVTAGLRANYWDLNNQTVISPRANIAMKPDWERDFLFRFSTGYYHQPAFYRELRNFEGELNKEIKAQESIHFVLSSDYNFTAWGRPFKFVGEAYYKKMNNIIPYKIDNLNMRYYAENSADAYAVGADFKVNGEFVKGVDSWVNIGVLSIKEDLKNDFYYEYYNASGERVYPGFTLDDVATDSVRKEPGYIPKPTDQRLNFSLFFQDYLPKNPSYLMNLTFHYGSGLPFGPSSSERFRDTLRIPAYLRVDLGLSKQLIGKDTQLKENNPFRHFKSIWLGLDVFNLLQRNNVLSYLWVTDVTNRQYAVPNYLTSRQINLKLRMEF